MASLFIMRGLPGSGKSFLAKTLWRMTDASVVFSTDDYFISGNGEYIFDRNKLGHYHKLNQERTRTFLADNFDVFVDNTNITWKEIKTYVDIGVEYKSSIYVVEAATPWGKNPEECFKRNSHGVPLEAITRMYNNFASKESVLKNMEGNVFFHAYLTVGVDE